MRGERVGQGRREGAGRTWSRVGVSRDGSSSLADSFVTSWVPPRGPSCVSRLDTMTRPEPGSRSPIP